MHIHILGICGTFMGSLAQLAKADGHRVSGCDDNVYPPMSEQLEYAGIELTQGYDPAQLQPAPDLVVVGNALSRDNPCVEYMLREQLPYTSGPQWLGDHFLQGKWVLAVAGTHGKTTTSSMLAWILDYAGLEPGFLIGGVPNNFDVSARLGGAKYFVVEADEYDTAFFDKRSKFVHYRPRTAVLNNLEFDHADIFENLHDIQLQFHHLVRTIADDGLVIHPQSDQNISDTLSGKFDRRYRADKKYVWSPVQTTGEGGQWQVELDAADGSAFTVANTQKDQRGECEGGFEVRWQQSGLHNVANALAAIAAANHVGVSLSLACQALSAFEGVKRRMECLGQVDGISIYDDFAHHPTAIATTLDGLRNKVGKEKIIAVVEPRSNTMKLGVHKTELIKAVAQADQVFWFQNAGMAWSLDKSVEGDTSNTVVDDLQDLVEQTACAATAQKDEACHILIMSNGGFGGFHHRLFEYLQATKDR
ncbi:MAG: UDP-N-acetylmuramate:L-alanyl-gamma-D-glutamyl-meso-diaminopimelate ligase [Porticoccaceae bacterium]|nr:UDP-N-acetylmuramate:L-alanyl-gamma-D-glutamyl-meso-diaminopimelate ligase [Porticoccaceae bacterium]